MSNITKQEVIAQMPRLIAEAIEITERGLIEWNTDAETSVSISGDEAYVEGWYKTNVRFPAALEYQMIVTQDEGRQLKVKSFALLREIVEGKAERCF